MRQETITAAVVRFVADQTDRVITAAVVIAHAFHLRQQMCLAMPLAGSKRGSYGVLVSCRPWQQPSDRRCWSPVSVAA